MERDVVPIAIRALPFLLLIAALPGPLGGEAVSGETGARKAPVCTLSLSPSGSGARLPARPSSHALLTGGVLLPLASGDARSGGHGRPRSITGIEGDGASPAAGDGRASGRSRALVSDGAALEAAPELARARAGLLSHGATAPPCATGR